MSLNTYQSEPLDSTHSCSVATGHEGLLIFLGSVMAIAFVISLLSGKAYCRRVIDKSEEPFTYWSTVFAYGFLALFVFVGLATCPVG